MPKLIEYFGLIFYFYSNEYLPVHVHVSHAEYETIFELFFEDGKLTDIHTRKADGIEMLPQKDQKEAMKVVETYADEIVQKWLDFFVLKKKPQIRKITKRL
ncbi:DUF4160 domain-containing protein [Spirosoma rhododendri]|uniref:DUF4160 domain-containing protein n=1 Tax=Spirosoma rhododendri TaxID=2728024 RepID=A0A7L5DRI7_9BACT|nr:DUF4160 domain-containing protein [Spirosoma rhododendri]QJD81114.1 DUF4160 domain-containing protein [Spirosoma rhododendri]